MIDNVRTNARTIAKKIIEGVLSCSNATTARPVLDVETEFTARISTPYGGQPATITVTRVSASESPEACMWRYDVPAARNASHYEACACGGSRESNVLHFPHLEILVDDLTREAGVFYDAHRDEETPQHTIERRSRIAPRKMHADDAFLWGQFIGSIHGIAEGCYAAISRDIYQEHDGLHDGRGESIDTGILHNPEKVLDAISAYLISELRHHGADGSCHTGEHSREILLKPRLFDSTKSQQVEVMFSRENDTIKGLFEVPYNFESRGTAVVRQASVLSLLNYIANTCMKEKCVFVGRQDPIFHQQTLTIRNDELSPMGTLSFARVASGVTGIMRGYANAQYAINRLERAARERKAHTT